MAAGADDGPGLGGLAERARAVSHGVVAALPAAVRSRASGLLDAGVRSGLQGLMEEWGRNAGLDRTSFARRFLGRDAADPVAEQVHAAALALAHATDHAGLGAATEHLARALQAVGTDGWHAMVADARTRAEQAPAAGPVPLAADTAALLVRATGRRGGFTRGHGTPAHHGGPARAAGAHRSPAHVAGGEAKPHEAMEAENITELARIIETEAGGQEAAVKAAVGWAVRNRMLRNGSHSVSQESHAFTDGKAPKPESVAIAAGILNGSIADPTGGATHFYSPQGQPKEGHLVPRTDGRGGLESVTGVEADRKPVRNYAPSWTISPNFERRPVSGIEDKVFKFYKQLDDGRHHRVQ